ncbi:MAG: D-glycero-beta-D-manno-heptose-7-phosphate kinase [Bacteroidales bacterium]|nr:D-glycero-beta-D-manno-heptose-7-phosphate kinase [Bacteroidales bacterium]
MPQDLKEKLNQFRNKKILIVGDVMVDAYVWGKVTRISPEAPVPIVSVTKKEARLGGAANVALNIKSLGASPLLASIVGNDEQGLNFLRLLKDSDISQDGILQTDRPTTVKTRVLSGSQHTLRIDEELTTPIDKNLEEKLINRVKQLFASNTIDGIIFQDYDKGVLTENGITKITEIAQSYSVPIFVDPKKNNFNHYKQVTVFKPNFKEFTEGLKLEIEKHDISALHQAAKKFMQTMNIQYMLVTLSELGIFVCDAESYYHIPTTFKQIADVSGAGDTVISVVSLCICSGISITDTAHIANTAGGIVCSYAGVVPIKFDDLVGVALVAT